MPRLRKYTPRPILRGRTRTYLPSRRKYTPTKRSYRSLVGSVQPRSAYSRPKSSIRRIASSIRRPVRRTGNGLGRRRPRALASFAAFDRVHPIHRAHRTRMRNHNGGPLVHKHYVTGKRHAHDKKTLVHHTAPFYVSGGQKPSMSFKAKVEESLSYPVTFTWQINNVLVGAIANVGYPPAKYFQPHNIAAIIGATPTLVTQQMHYLFDYPSISAVLDGLYTNIGTSVYTMKQHVRVSGHMEYTLKNETNDNVKVTIERWSCKKPVPRDLCSITETADPLSTTFPVYTGNILNCMGAAWALDSIEPASSANAANTALEHAEHNNSQSPTINEFFDLKRFDIILRPGRSRKFSVGRKLLEIDTVNNFVDFSQVSFTNQGTWANAFIPGACGLLFRVHGSPCVPTGGVTDYSPMAYSQPEMLLMTKVNYVAYDWKSNAETQDDTTFLATGIAAGTNATINTILPETDAKSNIIVA